MGSLRASKRFQKPFEYGVDDSLKAGSAVEEGRTSRRRWENRGYLNRWGVFQWMFIVSLILRDWYPE